MSGRPNAVTPCAAPSKKGNTRRHFLMQSVGAAAAAWTAESYARIIGANDRIGVGVIGAGGMGRNHLNALERLKESNNLSIVGVADCWTRRAEQGADLVEAEVASQDFRQLLELPEIDYLTIATPEHRHAEIALEALNAGKHLYCEKPVTHTIAEAFAVQDKAQSTGLAVQVGIQGMSDDSYESAGQAIENGLLGDVTHAQIEYVRRYGKQGLFRNPDVKDDQPQPPDLDWSGWLGPAPHVPWDPHHFHEWRCYAAYSGGIAADLFIHRLSRIMKACRLEYPSRVVGMGGIWQWPDGRDLPDTFEMICEYPRGMTVYVLGTQNNRHPIEHCIRGYRATLFFTGDGWVAKNKDGKVLQEHKRSGAQDIALHHTNLHQHLRNGEKLHCPVEFGVAATLACCMANESWRSGQMLSFDTSRREVVPAAPK